MHALQKAAIAADQNVKLSIFATRPAVYSPVLNWLTEAICTLLLIAGALLVGKQGDLVPADLRPLYLPLKAFFTGLLVVTLILSLGGPTGIAMNPFRDLGPRLAHFLLPISGKGPSEWSYAWVPVTAGLAGGALGACTYMGISSLYIVPV